MSLKMTLEQTRDRQVLALITLSTLKRLKGCQKLDTALLCMSFMDFCFIFQKSNESYLLSLNSIPA